MSVGRVLAVLGRTATAAGGVEVPSHAALRVLMVLPAWPFSGWVGLFMAAVISGTVCGAVCVVLRTRDPARPQRNAVRHSDPSYFGKGRTKKR